MKGMSYEKKDIIYYFYVLFFGQYVYDATNKRKGNGERQIG